MDFADAAIKFYTKWDAPIYSNFCYKSKWSAEVLKFSTKLAIDVNECAFGLLDYLIEDEEVECEWNNYKVDYAVWSYKFLPE